MNFTPAQHDAIHLDGNLVVTAGAGSGKTRVLVERYLRLLAQHQAEEILAITFTEKAAREMRERVRRTVEQRARVAQPADRPMWEAHRAAIESARIGTIHSFCAALLRAHPAETSLDPQFTVLDEVEAGVVLAESVNEALKQIVDRRLQIADYSEQAALLEEFGLAELRAFLGGMLRGGGEVRAAVAALPETVDGLLELWQERLALAQSEARENLVTGATWRAAVQTLFELAPAAPAGDRIGDQVLALAPLLAQGDWGDFAAVDGINLTGGGKKAWGGDEPLQAAKAALRTLRDSYRAVAPILTLAFDEALERRAAAATLGLAALYCVALTCYTRRKQALDALDFDDLERYAAALLQQPTARARWRAELRAVLVDEFQDTNDEQRQIVYALTGIDQMAGAPQNLAALQSPPTLFVVGDGKQSIYRFRGADVSVFQAVARDIVGGNGRAVALDTSFRTHLELIGWVNQVTETIFARESALRPYEFPFEPLVAHRPSAPHPHCLELHMVAAGGGVDEKRAAEAATLANRLAALVAGEAGPIVFDEGLRAWRVPTYGDIAMLFQASTVFETYEAALRAANIPYLTTAGRGYYGRKEVQDLIHLLRVLDDPNDTLALVGVLRSPLFALDDATILRLHLTNDGSLWSALMVAASIPDETISNFQSPISNLHFAATTLRHLHVMRARLTVPELLRECLARTGYLATISGLEDGARRRVNVEKLIEAARLAGGSGLRNFRDYLDTLLKAETREGEAPLEAEGSVRLMTVHRSKGLEFPIVVLPDMGRSTRGRFEPWLARRAYGLALQLRDERGEAETSAAYELARAEEARMERAERERLLYVALTRAKDYLMLSGPVGNKSGDDWLSRLVTALGSPWEAGGPPEGAMPPLTIFRHER
ncbi:MAG: UvrD-helicase domain-containing protein [Chloroflexaceae bacterium]|nr:UvrD-helicase domain-containing protein [Chloroflexaceae bacterium]